MPHDLNGDGVLRYTPEDVQAGYCDPSQLWRPVPSPSEPSNVAPLPLESLPPPTAKQLREDVLDAYKRLGGSAYLVHLAAESPPAFLKLLTNAIYQAAADESPEPENFDREQMRRMQIAEQRAIIAAHRPASLAGDTKASEVIIKASDRLAKLAGTDQPRLMAVSHSTSLWRLSDDELLAIASGQTLVQGEDGTYAVPDDAA